MIKTNYKSKIGKGFTHSLGSKRISELLSGIEIYDNLSISFDKSEGGRMGLFVPGWNLRYLKGNSKELLEFRTIIGGIYSTASDKWFINLKPVPVSENKKVKSFLIEKSDFQFYGNGLNLKNLKVGILDIAIFKSELTKI